MHDSSKWYDRQGKMIMEDSKIGSKKWQEQMSALEKLLTDMKYKRVAETTLPDGRWVSTVWLGLDHSFSGGPPLIFETMVFKNKGDMAFSLDTVRYSTEAEAKTGHKAMVKKWK